MNYLNISAWTNDIHIYELDKNTSTESRNLVVTKTVTLTESRENSTIKDINNNYVT